MPSLSALRRLTIGTTLILAAVLLAGCDKKDGGTGPTPPPVEAPVITCPADSVNAVERAPLTVTYPPPVVTGGSPPVATECTPASSTSFPAGQTDVVCTATDAIQRRAQCVFHVTVNVVPRLLGTTFLAFGDSITAGEDGTDAMSQVMIIDAAHSYPTVLEALLKDRYQFQASSIHVVNVGQPLEKVTSDSSQQRLLDEIDATKPDVVLFLEGVNDVNDGKISPAMIGQAVKDNVRRAYQQHGVKLVIVSTLLPKVPGRLRGGNAEGIPPANDAILDGAQAAGAVIVDAFTTFDPQKELLIGFDGLHPTPQGNQVLAKLFLDAIAGHFQQAPAAAASSLDRFSVRPSGAARAPRRP